MMDWALALSSAAQAVSLVKDLREIDKGLGDAETKLKLADLYTNLSDVKMALVDAQFEMREKDKQLEDMRGRFAVRETLVSKDGFKYSPDAEGRPKGLAICPRCEAIDGVIIQLVRQVGHTGISKCPQCKQEYEMRSTFAIVPQMA